MIPRSVLERLGASRGAVPCPVDPVLVARAAGPIFGEVRWFSEPGGRIRLGLGRQHRYVAAGPDRFATLREALVGRPAGEVAFVGFGFDPEGPASPEWAGFPAAEAVVPEVWIEAGSAGATIEVHPEATGVVDRLAELEAVPSAGVLEVGDHTVTSIPAPSTWRRDVAEAVEAIRSGTMTKVVLARAVRIVSAERPHPFELVDRLGLRYPGSYTFAWSHGPATFLGASPELLVASDLAWVRSNPLAGSAPRGEGELADEELGRGLMASPKDRLEHAIVVDDVAARLRPFVEDLEVPSEPSLRRMATVQHLSTTIVGRLARRVHLLDLVAALHPTPAVGGAPRDEAARFIAKVEAIDRGWYTGGVGWVDGTGRGEVAIALRCGLLGSDGTTLYAGAGIVADSEPDEELVETRLKFRPLLELLAAT